MKKSGFVNSLQRLQWAILLVGPIALFFSYHPVISIGSTDTTNFEFSLAEIWLVLFAIVSLVNLKSLIKFYGKKLFLLSSFPVYALLSSIWSANHLRALLTSGLLLLLVFVGLNIYHFIKTHPAKLKTLQKILILAGIGFSLFCWLQCVLDLLGLSRSVTLLCRGCTYLSFGYPHPNGFAIEPQFAGNLLLAPALLAMYGLVEKRPLFSKAWQTIFTIFLISTIFLTFSRGAIYALIIGLGLIFLAQFPVIKYIKKKSNKDSFNARAFSIIPIALGCFLFVLCIQGVFAELSPTSDTFWTGVSKSIHQLSLGKIDLRPAELTDASSQTSPTESVAVSTSSAPEVQPETTQSSFDGYVEESSAFRSELTRDALDVWNDSPTNLLFGTGLGSAGIKLYEKHPELGFSKEIVQNQYASILLELGLVGFLLAALTVGFIIYWIRPDALLISVLVAFAFTLFFFGGLPNALHVYLFPILLSHPSVERAGRHKE